MSPDDREAITRSIANLWTLQTIVLAEVMRAVRDAGALSPEQCTRLLERIDGYADALDGEDDQAYATNLLATVRQMLERE
jgi:hypothetical protein